MDVGKKTWVFGKADDADDGDSKSSIGSISEDSSMDSVMSLSSSSLSEQSTEEAPESSTTSSSSSSSGGPLHTLSQLMNSLPIKRGLSMFYEGKARSFTSLATVESIGDLPKKETAYNCRKRMKSSKSYAGDLDRSRVSPKAIISKKSSRRSLGSALSSSSSKGGSFLGGSRLSFAVHKNF